MKTALKEGERAIVVAIKGTQEMKNYFLANGIALGTIITKNYSPSYAGLINLTFSGKMLSLRKSDFENIELIKI